MNFDLGDKEKGIRKRLHQALDPELPQILHGLMAKDPHSNRATLQSAFKKIAETGYPDYAFYPEQYGAGAMAVREELAYICPALYLSIEAGNGLLLRILELYGSEEQKQKMAPSLRSCKAIGSIGLTEEHGNIDENPFHSSLTRQEGHLLLGAKKNMVINGAVADWLAIVANMDGQLALALISPQTVSPNVGKRISTFGLEHALFYRVETSATSISANNVIGPFDAKPFTSQIQAWQDEILIGAALGIARRAFDTARDHAKSHNCGGKPIVAYQEVGFKLAEMLTLIHTAQLLAYRGAWMCQAKDREASILVHCAKVFCGEAAETVSSSAVQILGGSGYIRGNRAEEAYRDAKFIQLTGTSTERGRVKIGDLLLMGITGH